MRRIVVIDCFAETALRYGSGWAAVVVDVIRATTTAVTATASGRRCYPVPDVQCALAMARAFPDSLLAGESQGATPAGFEMDNSPAQLAGRTDTHRPLILVSSSGTRALHAAAACQAVYLACFRSYSALAGHLGRFHNRVALIGAGTRGEFREEDQICCAWIAAALMHRGYRPGTAATAQIARRWQDAPAAACLCSRSVDFLKQTGRCSDLDFILRHVDDLPQIFEFRNSEVRTIE